MMTMSSHPAIERVYKRYAHLDELLSDQELMAVDAIGRVLWDCWQAIRDANGAEAQAQPSLWQLAPAEPGDPGQAPLPGT